jgi:tRNA 5-methylaminomethyl-2-thiouridine biosynthesis bifunctional protein
MSRLPPRPELNWKDDGTPVARDFDDVYFSLSDGLEETRNVFLKACGLPERWENTRSFTIAELGFGTGLNFLGLVDCWLNSARAPDAWLHFLSVEKFLMSAEEAGRVLGRWPALEAISDVLLNKWPVRTPGLQRIEFAEWRISLTLYIGDVEDWLKSSVFAADAWFLDGFAPAKNESMWGEGIYPLMASHSKPGCMVGTYTVAGTVRRGLASVGFQVSKQPGFGRKRERLQAIWPEGEDVETEADIYLTSPRPSNFGRIVVVGGGIAGASLARAFLKRGYEVNLLETSPRPAEGASGNPYGLVMPRLDAADTPQARLLIQTYLYALKFYAETCPEFVERVTVRQFAQNEKETARFAKLLADPPLDADWLQGVSEEDRTGLIHFGSALAQPRYLVPALLDHPKIHARYGVSGRSEAQLRAEFGEDALIIFAGGWQSADLLSAAGLPVIGRLGQVDWGKAKSGDTGAEACAAGTYALKARGDILFGATFAPIEAEETPEVSDAARSENLEGLARLAPDWVNEVEAAALVSRASVRATTPDRMPLCGVLFDAGEFKSAISPLLTGSKVNKTPPHHPNSYVLTGLGARGFTFAPLLGELIAAQALGEPLPLARPELEQVSPARFAVRAVRRGQ